MSALFLVLFRRILFITIQYRLLLARVFMENKLSLLHLARIRIACTENNCGQTAVGNQIITWEEKQNKYHKFSMNVYWFSGDN